MRVLLPTKETASTGKGKFLNRLAKELTKSYGVEIVNTPDQYHDIYMDCAKFRFKSNARKVLRLNGIYNDIRRNWKTLNQNIRTNMFMADAVVYQSHFSKKLCGKYLGEFDGLNWIIHNGANPNDYNVSVNGLRYADEFDKFVICSSRWRPHKRLEDIIQSFMVADIPDACLLVCGEWNYDFKVKVDHRIKFLGRIDENELRKYLKLADLMIHICWQDNCPNSVVEGICAGLSVITNNVCGTREVVDLHLGRVLNIDPEYDYEPCDLYNPPKVDHNKIASVIKSILSRTQFEVPVLIDISYIAKKYYEFFQRVIEAR